MATHSTTTVTLEQMAELIEFTYLPRAAAVIVIGSPGNGKTSRIDAIIRKLQASSAFFGGCGMNCGGAQGIDMIGLPSASDSPLSRYGAPTWMQSDTSPKVGFRGAFSNLCPAALRHPDDKMPAVDNPTMQDMTMYRRGIVRLDEIAAGGDDTVWQPICQIMNDGGAGNWGVDPTMWARIGICNAVEHHSMARDLPANLRNRTAIIHVRTVLSDFEHYWRSQGMHPAFVSFATENSGMLLSDDVPAGQEQFATARSWMEAWADCMAYCRYKMKLPSTNGKGLPYDPGLLPGTNEERDGTSSHGGAMLCSLIAARCGEAVALSFGTFLTNLNQMPKLADILAKPGKVPVPTSPGVLHAMLASMTEQWSLHDIDTAMPFLLRVPPAMITMFTTNYNRRHRGIVGTSTAFMKLVAHGGAGAFSNAIS